jgi:hypothetical protein
MYKTEHFTFLTAAELDAWRPDQSPPVETKPLICPWQLCRDVAAMLPYKDEQVALRIITDHERQHVAAANLELTEGAD